MRMASPSPDNVCAYDGSKGGVCTAYQPNRYNPGLPANPDMPIMCYDPSEAGPDGQPCTPPYSGPGQGPEDAQCNWGCDGDHIPVSCGGKPLAPGPQINQTNADGSAGASCSGVNRPSLLPGESQISLSSPYPSAIMGP